MSPKVSALPKPVVRHWPMGDFQVEVVYKAIRHAYLRIYPPAGRVRLSVPLKTSNLRIQQILDARLAWLTQQRARLLAQAAAQEGQQKTLESKNLFIEGAIHAFWGQAYRVQLHPEIVKTSKLWLQDGVLCMAWAANTSESDKKRCLLEFQRQLLCQRIPSLLDIWQKRLRVQISAWRLREMRTRWGSCNTQAKRINLAVSLVAWPRDCLEYVLVHELLHLLEPRHNAHFYQLMEGALPDWRIRHHRLRLQPLEFIHPNQHTETAVV